MRRESSERRKKVFSSSSWENNAEIAHTRPREKVINRDTRTKVEEQTKKALPIKKNSRTENGTTCSFPHFFALFARENWPTALSDGFGSCQKAETRERWLFFAHFSGSTHVLTRRDLFPK